MSPRNLLTEWAHTLFDALATAGVRDVVMSPGSRCTPFVLAAAGDRRLTLHDVIDERSAAFFALGHAKTTGRAVALLCTSGTAPAHYLPAVIEASEVGAPLVIVTADRPFELQGCGAPQTVDQVKLFGDHARAYFDLGDPDASAASLRAVRRVAAQAVLAASHPRPGAVHVQARARKPLEPIGAASFDERALAELAAGVRGEPLTLAIAPRVLAAPEALDRVARDCSTAARGAIVCGPAPLASRALVDEVAALARESGFVLCAEAGSQLRHVAAAARAGVTAFDSFDLCWRTAPGRAALAPDVVIQLGATPTSSSFDALVSSAIAPVRHVLATHGWPDPHGRAASVVLGDLHDALVTLRRRLGELRGTGQSAATSWARRVSEADRAAWACVRDELDAARTHLTEGQAVRGLLDALPADALLAIGNSLPIREVDTFVPSVGRPLSVWTQRGANGIDGLVSGAAGAARASGRPCALLLGDVSLLHDLGGLAVARSVATPLVVLVVNNGGGRIFEQLPIASCASVEPAALAHFTTPPSLDLASAAAAFGLRHVAAASGDALEHALGAALGHAGCTVVEAVVPPHEARAQNARVIASVESALRGMS